MHELFTESFINTYEQYWVSDRCPHNSQPLWSIVWILSRLWLHKQLPLPSQKARFVNCRTDFIKDNEKSKLKHLKLYPASGKKKIINELALIFSIAFWCWGDVIRMWMDGTEQAFGIYHRSLRLFPDYSADIWLGGAQFHSPLWDVLCECYRNNS